MSISTTLGEQREVRIDGATLRYRETGQGSPLLFVHGLAVNGDLWRSVVPLLAARHRCITPDLPLGSHDIPVDDRSRLSPRGVADMLVGLIRALELRDVTIVANDTGGAITQILITEHPGTVARVVLTPCDCFENFLPPAFKPLQVLGRSAAFWWVAARALRWRPMLRTPFAFGLLMRSGPPPDIAESWLGPLRRSRAVRRDIAAFVGRIDKRDTIAAGARLGDYDGRVLIAWGALDRAFPPRYGERLATAFGDGARLVMVPESRTFVPEDQPEMLARLIDEFVPGAATTSGAAARPSPVTA